jgi:hypothetical protein
MLVVLAAAALALAQSACGGAPAGAGASAPADVPTPVVLGTVTKATRCQAGYLPDRACTPGAVDPRVTQANIAQTICRAGYARRVRPLEDITTSLKHERLRAYGLPDIPAALRAVELDHLVSLELGGAPASLANLWPEPWNDSPDGPGAHTKDVLEDRLHELVCSGQMPLAEAQQKIATDWYAEYRALGLSGQRADGVD